MPRKLARARCFPSRPPTPLLTSERAPGGLLERLALCAHVRRPLTKRGRSARARVDNLVRHTVIDTI